MPSRPPLTWEQFKAAVRRADRDSLLIQAAAATSGLLRDGFSEEWSKFGLTPWNIADVARTALAWGDFQRPEATPRTLLELCNLNTQLSDQVAIDNPDSEDLGRLFARMVFEQFPGQRSVLAELARTLLLFGSASQHPPNFTPTAMIPGWFETVSGGLTLDDYAESVFLISVVALQSNGAFSPSWLDGPSFEGLEDLVPFEAVRHTFTEHLVTTVGDFKVANRAAQDPLPSILRKFAFNPLADRPFIEGVVPTPIAPWVQAIIAKALPPAIYHLARRTFGDDFSHDLGAVFQYYIGRQLEQIQGERRVLPETPYGPRTDRKDSCDWFLDLPELLVLIECKARQPIESLRTGGPDWLNSVMGSIGKGFKQLERSDAHIDIINEILPELDTEKPRVGIVVTLEPFYLNQNWFIWDHLPTPDLPIGVVSASELEQLVCLSANELADLILGAKDSSTGNMLLLNEALRAAGGRENPLLTSTWESIGLLRRAEAASARLKSESDESG